MRAWGHAGYGHPQHRLPLCLSRRWRATGRGLSGFSDHWLVQRGYRQSLWLWLDHRRWQFPFVCSSTRGRLLSHCPTDPPTATVNVTRPLQLSWTWHCLHSLRTTKTKRPKLGRRWPIYQSKAPWITLLLRPGPRSPGSLCWRSSRTWAPCAAAAAGDGTRPR